MLLLGGSYY